MRDRAGGLAVTDERVVLIPGLRAHDLGQTEIAVVQNVASGRCHRSHPHPTHVKIYIAPTATLNEGCMKSHEAFGLKGRAEAILDPKVGPSSIF